MIRRPFYKKRAMKTAKARLHAPKKFTASFKLRDIISDASGTNPGGWQRNNLAVNFTQLPIHLELSSLYKQFAITGVAFQYRSTNTNPDNLTEPATQMLFVEDKDNTGAITVGQALSQDNCRKLKTDRNFKHYVRKPRPQLYQSDGTNPVFAIQAARQITWFNTGANTLPHLCAQLLVEDSAAGTSTKQGELWVKMYVICKEQCASGL